MCKLGEVWVVFLFLILRVLQLQSLNHIVNLNIPYTIHITGRKMFKDVDDSGYIHFED